MKKINFLSIPAAERPKTLPDYFLRTINPLKPALLPILLAVIPTLYYYGKNVGLLTPISLYRMVVLNTSIAIVIYVICLLIFWRQPFKAAGAAFIFLIFFNIYGAAYKYLLRLDVFQVEHYTSLPLILMVAIYAVLFLTRLKEPVLAILWKNLVLIVGVLALINLFTIVPAELRRWRNNTTTSTLNAYAHKEIKIDKNSPDIYYIVLDEFAGFQAMRDYWQYDGVDEFVSFLKDKGFFVAEESHGSSKETLYELASRLNYQNYPLGTDRQILFNDIASNRVMQYLKSRGYTTVVFDETKLPHAASKTIEADHVYEFSWDTHSSIPETTSKGPGFYLDDFGALVMSKTMYSALPQKYQNNTRVMSRHNNMINFTVENISDSSIPSPKFVYVHLMLPHPPFMFSSDGAMESGHFTDWNYYLDNYIYSIKVTKQMVNNILQNADPENPPVIILQSDHGARNESTVESIFLPDYPEKFKTLILYSLYIPGYDYSTLPQNINPVNTFPIVFNHIFNTDIPLLK